MKPDKQRIAIAEYCGWKDVRGHMGIPPEDGMLFPYPEHHEEDWRLKPFRGLPDYPNDLNAMHEAEKSLALPYRKEAYWLHLTEICEPSKEYWRATAAQRAEAFLKTIGKWQE